MNKYEFKFEASCPNNSNKDYYHIEMESDSIIQVEDIHRFLSEISKPIYQEEFTDLLSENFAASITVVGFHQKIKITTKRNQL